MTLSASVNEAVSVTGWFGAAGFGLAASEPTGSALPGVPRISSSLKSMNSSPELNCLKESRSVSLTYGHPRGVGVRLHRVQAVGVRGVEGALLRDAEGEAVAVGGRLHAVAPGHRRRVVAARRARVHHERRDVDRLRELDRRARRRPQVRVLREAEIGIRIREGLERRPARGRRLVDQRVAATAEVREALVVARTPTRRCRARPSHAGWSRPPARSRRAGRRRRRPARR